MQAGKTEFESSDLPEGDDPVAIRRYPHGFDAALDLATLESYGIAAEIVGDTVGDTLNWSGLAMQTVELVVPRRRVAEAQRVLAETSAGQSETPHKDWICPDCGEINGCEFDSCWSCARENIVADSAK